jgi:copper(I)-binding protein
MVPTPLRRGLLLATLFTALGAQAQSAPKVEAAWARPTVAGQAGGGGFLKITGGAAADKLLAVNAGIARSVELHTMNMDGNVMRMRQVEGIAVPAGQTVELKPGGLHIMFMGLTQALKAGDSFPLTLRFEKGGEVKVEMKVMNAPAGAMPAGEHKH